MPCESHSLAPVNEDGFSIDDELCHLDHLCAGLVESLARGDASKAEQFAALLAQAQVPVYLGSPAPPTRGRGIRKQVDAAACNARARSRAEAVLPGLPGLLGNPFERGAMGIPKQREQRETVELLECEKCSHQIKEGGYYQQGHSAFTSPHYFELYEQGERVEYFSTSWQQWVPATVLGVDELAGTYTLDIHPAALPSKMRRLSSQPMAINSPPMTLLPMKPEPDPQRVDNFASANIPADSIKSPTVDLVPVGNSEEAPPAISLTTDSSQSVLLPEQGPPEDRESSILSVSSPLSMPHGADMEDTTGLQRSLREELPSTQIMSSMSLSWEPESETLNGQDDHAELESHPCLCLEVDLHKQQLEFSPTESFQDTALQPDESPASAEGNPVAGHILEPALKRSPSPETFVGCSPHGVLPSATDLHAAPDYAWEEEFRQRLQAFEASAAQSSTKRSCSSSRSAQQHASRRPQRAASTASIDSRTSRESAQGWGVFECMAPRCKNRIQCTDARCLPPRKEPSRQRRDQKTSGSLRRAWSAHSDVGQARRAKARVDSEQNGPIHDVGSEGFSVYNGIAHLGHWLGLYDAEGHDQNAD